MNSDTTEHRDFRKRLRAACRKVYENDHHMDEDVSLGFGDALAFYSGLSGLPWKAAAALASAGYFYPNDVIEAPDTDLLAISGIGPATVRRVREVLDGIGPEFSCSEFLDRLDGTIEPPLPFPLPRRAVFTANLSS